MIYFFLLPINFPIHRQDFNDFYKEGVFSQKFDELFF